MNMNDLIRRISCLALAFVLVFALAACNNTPEPTDPPVVEDPTEAPTEAPTEPAATGPALTSAITSLYISYGENFDSQSYISVMDMYDGTYEVTYQGDVKKIGIFDASVMDQLAQAINGTMLMALIGQDVYDEGEANASFSLSLADDTYPSVGFSGTIPQEFMDGYAALDQFFQELTADLPVYVPQAQVMGEVNADALTAMQEILNNSGMSALDSMAITDVAKDEYFGMTMGLTGHEGLTAGTSCSSMMMTSAYSLNIATLADGTDAAAVAADFQNNLNWDKWVCVRPTGAMIATKGNMVLCLMAADDNYTLTANAIKAAGWEITVELTDPGV